MSLVQIWRMLRARRTVIVALLVAGGLLGAIVSQVRPDHYTARTRMVMKATEPDPVTGEAVPVRNIQAYAQTMAELVHDDNVAASAAEKLGWQNDAAMQAAYRADPSASFPIWLGRFVSANTEGKMLANSNIFEISFTANDPQTARLGANAVRAAFIERTAATRREEAQRNAQWFGRQSDDLKRRLADAEQRKAQFERANNVVLQDDNQDTESAKLKALAASPPPASPAIASAPVAAAPSSGQLAAVDAQIASLQQTLGPNHPQMVALQRQRAALAAAVGRETAAARPGAVQQGPSLQAMLDAQTRKVLASRGLVGQAQMLAGEVSVLRDQLTKTRQKAADFQLEAQTTETRIEPLGEAVTPMSPDSPGTWLFILIGLILGGGLGLAIGLGLEMLYRRIRGEEDLAIDGVPLLGSMVERRNDEGADERLFKRLGLNQPQPEPAT